MDLDGASPEPIKDVRLRPHFVVESSPGKYHFYWMVGPDFPLDKFTLVQKALALKFDGDPSVCDLPRVMRLPGLFHTKDSPVLTNIIEANSCAQYSFTEIVEGLELDLSKSTALYGQKATFDISKRCGDGERTHALTKFIGALIKQGEDDQTILELVRAWNCRNHEPLSDEKLVATLKDIRKCDDSKKGVAESIFDQMNGRFSLVTVGNKAYVMDKSKLQLTIYHLSDFRAITANLPKIEGMTAANYWLQHPDRSELDGIVFDPSGNHESNVFNTWKGFSVTPQSGDCSFLLDHILNNVCSGDDALNTYLLNWLADGVQNPASLPGVAVVMRGKQGTGKGVLARAYGSIFGSHFKHIQSYNQLLGRFNGLLQDAAFIFCDEVIWGGNRKESGSLKTLITEPERTVELKNKDAFQVRNYSRVMMATNDDWVVPAEAKERRYFALNVSDRKIQDTEYFASVQKQLDSGGLEAFLYLLLNRDLTGVDIRKVPQTDALAEQKALSLKGVHRWFYDCLNAGHIDQDGFIVIGGDAEIRKSDVYKEYLSWCARTGDRYPVQRESFFKTLKEISVYLESRRRIGCSRIQMVTFGSLESCAERFSGVTGVEVACDGQG